VDEAIIKHYRRLLKTGFENAGSLNNPSIFLESTNDGRVCGHTGDYMHIFINILDGKVDSIKYLCACDPTVNVAVEILCNLSKGKRLDELEGLTEEPLFEAAGTRSEDLQKRARGLLELLKQGLTQYRERTTGAISSRY